MKKQNNIKLQATSYRLQARAFTLIEILIFTAIVSVFFVVAAAVTAVSLNIMRTNENKIYATHYAEEGSEWLLNEKDTTEWLTFSGRVTTSTTWCMNMSTMVWTTTGTCPTSGTNPVPYALGTEYGRAFNRDVTLAVLGDGSISSTVTVSWVDIGGTVRSVPVKTIFSQTE